MGSAPDTERWIICPVCHRENPEGAKFCQHCWGAALHDEDAVSWDELQSIVQRRKMFNRRRMRMQTGLIGLGIFAALFAVFITLVNYTDLIVTPSAHLNSTSPEGEWTMFRYDFAHTGVTGSSAIVPRGELKWSFQTGSSVQSSPAVVDGKLYIGSQDHNLYALDAATGAEDWSFQTGSWVVSSPSVFRDTVYFGSNDGKLYAMDTASGEVNWDFKTAYPVKSSPSIVGDTVYFGSDDYNIYALDLESGDEQWRFNTGGLATSSPVVYEGILIAGARDGFCYAMNAESGQHRLSFKSHYSVFAAPVIEDGIVYLVTSNGIVYGVEPDARTKWREHELKPFWTQMYFMGLPGIPQPPPQSGLLSTWRLPGDASSSPVLSEGVLYIGSGHSLVALDVENGEILWEFETGDTVRSSPALAAGILYVGSDDGSLYAVDAATGEMKWSYPTGDKISSSPAVVDGVVYFGSYNGKVYAIE